MQFGSFDPLRRLNSLFFFFFFPAHAVLKHFCRVYQSLLPEERLSAPSALDHNGPRHDVIHSPVVLEEEEGDEDGKEEGDGEVLVKCPHCRAGKDKEDKNKQRLD